MQENFSGIEVAKLLPKMPIDVGAARNIVRNGALVRKISSRATAQSA